MTVSMGAHNLYNCLEVSWNATRVADHEGRQPFEGELPVILVFRGAAPVAVPMRPPDMRPGRTMRTRRASLVIILILSCFFSYFISQFVNYRLWRREKTPVVAFYPDRLRIAYAGAKLVCPVLVQPVGADIEQQIERGMQALVLLHDK